jgi:hypothetical protein
MIAFCSTSINYNYDIFMIPASGGAEIQVTNTANYVDVNPSWSPDPENPKSPLNPIAAAILISGPFLPPEVKLFNKPFILHMTLNRPGLQTEVGLLSRQTAAANLTFGCFG